MLKKMIILLVEDNPDDEELTRLAFEESKLLNDVVVARDGAQALAYLLPAEGSEVHPLPNLVLLDLKLPKVDGLEVLKRIRESPRTATLPVVVLTTSKEECDLVNSYSLGCNSYIRKPVVFNEFIEAVRQLGMYWLMLNEPLPAWGSA